MSKPTTSDAKPASSSAGKPSPPRRSPLDACGERRAEFLLDFPRDPSLEPVIEAFELGNFAAVRRLAPELSTEHAEPNVRRAALELLARTRPDPLLVLLLGAAVALFAFLSAWAYAH